MIRPKKKNHNFVKSCNIRLCMFPIVNIYIFIEFYFIFYFLWETWIKNKIFFLFFFLNVKVSDWKYMESYIVGLHFHWVMSNNI